MQIYHYFNNKRAWFAFFNLKFSTSQDHNL